MSNLREQAKRHKQHIEAVSRFAKGRFQPLLKVSCSEKPYFSGTCFCLVLNGHEYLVTASHVLDKDENNPCDSDNQIFCLANGELKQIEHFEKKKIKVKTPNASATIDLAILSSCSIPIGHIFNAGFTETEFFSGPLDTNSYLTAIGFPGTKNKPKHDSNELTNRPYGYFGRSSPSEKLKKLGFDPAVYFGIEINIKKAYSDAGKKVRVAKPHGISGGPVFRVYDFNNPRDLFEPELVGVVVQMPKNSQCLVGINITCIAHALMNGM